MRRIAAACAATSLLEGYVADFYARFDLVLVFAGRNAREKHLDQLIQAIKRLGAGHHLLKRSPSGPIS